ncbi:MAG: SH3 domain-containing protein [Phaeodactylibacter sp.]|uniref:SH3 domain-containing protein n=1 Tax=Phaeodactylibacter sp. TaxID=1940289 RepID=UPI0032EEC346
MSEQSGMLPKIEILIIGGFFVLFMIWAVSKCAATQEAYEERAQQEAFEESKEDSLRDADLVGGYVPLDTTVRRLKAPKPEQEPAGAVNSTPLYVITPALNMRTGPGLRFKILERLELYDELQFLGEVTDTTQRIDLGAIVAEEPWVKVRTSSGKEGWVFGACIDYYKHELKGVETD